MDLRSDMNSILITLPLPARELSPNARVHWAKKSGITKAARWASFAASTNVLAEAGNKCPQWKRAKMHVKAYFKTRRFPDPTNFMASLKSYEDGIADAGIVENDRGLWPERPEFFTDKENPRIEITISQEP